MYSSYSNRSELSIINKIRSINYLFLSLIVIVFLFGLLSLYSVAEGNFNSWPIRHLYRFIVGVVVFFIVCLIDIKIIFRFAYPIFILSVLFIFITPFVGPEIYGATRWIKIGSISLQPSEFVKFTLILALAKYFHTTHELSDSFMYKFLIPLLIIVLPVIIVAIQPDLGTAVVIFLGGISILWVVGLNYKYFIVGAIGLITSLPLVWQYLKQYQKERVFTFFNPERDPLGNGYHIMQSKIALGSGGFFGKGLLDGTQSHLNFLPEMHTDFIFTMFAEEFGFLGSFILICLYMFIIFLMIRMSMNSRSLFGKYLSLGVSSVFFIYIFVNISMAMGLLPVVGVPLPFISYGGSSILAVMGGFGLLMNCHINQRTILPKGDFL